MESYYGIELWSSYMDTRLGCCMMPGLQNELECHDKGRAWGMILAGRFYSMLNFQTVKTYAQLSIKAPNVRASAWKRNVVYPLSNCSLDGS